ncbi:MAG TPA: hypothetical protein VGM44_09445 [Polyangiaceae bacterium]|jgi:hypothetical protein
MALASGCYAEADAEPAYVDATVAPVDVDVAPQYYYGGRTVYFVNDHWYTRDHGRWVYYRREPRELVRRREVIRRAPRAPNRVIQREAPHRAASPRRTTHARRVE